MQTIKIVRFFWLCMGISCTAFSDNDAHRVAFLKHFIPEGSLVFDVGANIGEKTQLYLACGAQVVCIEPQPVCVKALYKKFGKNSRVFIEPVGLAEKDSTLEMYICSSSNTISTFSQDWVNFGRFNQTGYKWDSKIRVPVTTLDTMIEKYGMPVFCKIDVENYEYEVLRGLHHAIACVSFEFAAESFEKTKQCIELLKELGFSRFNFGSGEHTCLMRSTWLSAQEMILLLEHLKKQDQFAWGDVYAQSV